MIELLRGQDVDLIVFSREAPETWEAEEAVVKGIIYFINKLLIYKRILYFLHVWCWLG